VKYPHRITVVDSACVVVALAAAILIITCSARSWSAGTSLPLMSVRSPKRSHANLCQPSTTNPPNPMNERTRNLKMLISDNLEELSQRLAREGVEHDAERLKATAEYLDQL
jgi:hypothetical protein